MSTSDSQCQLTTVAMCLIAAVLLLARSRARAPCRRARWHRVSMPADLLPASLCCGWRLAAAACIRMPHVRACMLLLPRPCMPQPVAGSGLARCQDALRLDAACLRCCLAHMLACLHFVLDGHMHACRTCWHASEWPWLPEPGTKRSAAVLVLSDVALYAKRELGVAAVRKPAGFAAAACRARPPWRRRDPLLTPGVCRGAERAAARRPRRARQAGGQAQAVQRPPRGGARPRSRCATAQACCLQARTPGAAVQRERGRPPPRGWRFAA